MYGYTVYARNKIIFLGMINHALTIKNAAVLVYAPVNIVYIDPRNSINSPAVYNHEF